MEDINLNITEQELKDLFCHLSEYLKTKDEIEIDSSDSNLFDIHEKAFELIREVDPKFFKTVPPFAVSYFNNIN